jgi:hypothetical protein
MTDDPKKPTPDVDRKTANGSGEGGHAPHPDKPVKPAPFDPHSYATPSDAGGAKEPKNNEEPIAPQASTDPKGTGHQSASGEVPEKQSTTEEQ